MYKYIIFLVVLVSSCNYLNIIPDNVVTIDNAFSLRQEAEKYLFTCYSHLPNLSNGDQNPAFSAGDETWYHLNIKAGNPQGDNTGWPIARGGQNVDNPYLNYWDGGRGASSMFRALRDCNIFLENIKTVPDMEDYEKELWSAEVKFLKAYYHFWLLRMYGPIPLIKENLPIDASVEEVKVERKPVAEALEYIVKLIDEAAEILPLNVESEIEEYGRITKPIALGMKAKIMVTLASPLFNGNNLFSHLNDEDGEPLINSQVDPTRWVDALESCRVAIQTAHDAGNELYHFQRTIATAKISDTTQLKMNVRGSVTAEINPEIIWPNTGDRVNYLQRLAMVRALNKGSNGWSIYALNAVPLKIADVFYTKHGVPIDEDKSYDYNGRYDLIEVKPEEKYLLKPGRTVAKSHVDREIRFYASLGVDGGQWFGQGKYNDDEADYLLNLYTEIGGVPKNEAYNVTGYFQKKLVHYESISRSNNTVTIKQYAWPNLRLADLYLLYAEAYNEVNGPGEEVFKYLDLIRERSGLPPVQDAWEEYSSNPSKPDTKEGLRDIIRQERMIEMIFEGQRYWDLRRWMLADVEYNKPITGWNVFAKTLESYYQPRLLYEQEFLLRDYFWPISQSELLRNPGLFQNPNW